MLSSRPRGACPILLLVRLSVIFSILSYISTSLASPLAVRPTHLSSLSKRYISTRANGLPSPKIGDGGPAESDYPNDDQIRGAFIPPAGPLVFFSGLPDPQNNQAPFEFTKTVPGATILRGAFPKAYITRKPQGGPRRSLEWYQNFLDRASGVYTDKAVEKGETVFFVGTWDAQNQRDYPGTNTENIIDPIFQPPKKRDQVGYLDQLEKRDTGICFDWPGTGEDANDPDSDPSLDTGYYPGWCRLHLQQFQKNEGPAATNGKHGISDYRFSIQIKDANQELIGQVDYFDAPTGQGVNVNSKLPAVLVAIAGGVDSDPVTFAYGGQNWDSNSKQCSTGGYQNGSRQMDWRGEESRLPF
ncbi:MAG: hypothetical protein LQ350_008011 [Teloschistes chrysophthalmus]|nr:MAG: hypothetical protein LQ350_008011 [Niorma chrysophthalma]